MKNLWAAEWHSKNSLDGETKHIIWENMYPKLFRTRADAGLFIKEKYGFIAERKDLRDEPHGWMMPKAVKVKLIVQV